MNHRSAPTSLARAHRHLEARRPASGRRVAAPALLLAALALTGCGRDAVVRAGKTQVDAEGWRQFQGRRSGGDQERGLEELSTRVLLAEAGRREGLLDRPELKARLAAAQRELLAQAYLDHALAGADREDALLERYRSAKDSLARRRIHPAHVAARIREGEPGSRQAAQSKISRAYASLAAGAPFEKVARELSDDEVTAGKGGDLGPLLEGEVDAVFFAAAAALEAGKVSAPVETPFGLHLVKALEPATTVTPPFEEVRGRLAAEARREAQAKLLERLRADIGVELDPARASAAAAPAAAKQGEGR